MDGILGVKGFGNKNLKISMAAYFTFTVYVFINTVH